MIICIAYVACNWLADRLNRRREREDIERLTRGIEREDIERLTRGTEREDIERLTRGTEREDIERLTRGIEREDIERLSRGTEREDIERLTRGTEREDIERLTKGTEREDIEIESTEMEKEVCESTGPRIIFPSQEVITIIETKEGEGAATAKTEVLALIKDLDAQIPVVCVITQQIDRRVMGGCGVRKIQEDFKVDLRFPRANENFDVIMITGEEDDVYDCKDHLLDIEEEFPQDLLYNEYIQSCTKAPSRNQDSQTTRGKAFMVFNAPLDAAPETSSTAKFPRFPGYWKYRGPKHKSS